MTIGDLTPHGRWEGTISGIGFAIIREPTAGNFIAAERAAAEAENKSTAFSTHLISTALEQPKLSEIQVANLDIETLAGIVNILVDMLSARFNI